MLRRAERVRNHVSFFLTGAAMLLLTGPVAALDLTLPGEAELTLETQSAADSYFIPTGRFQNDRLPVLELEGEVIRQAWRIGGGNQTTLQVMAPLRDQLREEGYTFLLDCVTLECGGFDFRLRSEVLPAPDMFVDLLDFRFLSAENPQSNAARYVSVLVSRAGAAAYVQLIAVGQPAIPENPVASIAAPAAPPKPVLEAPADIARLSLLERLKRDGHVVLPGLIFETGSSDLAEGRYDALEELAGYLKGNTDAKIALVGHTDSVGALDDNLALSQRRAASVLERLVLTHQVPEAQLEAHGLGFLAPVAANTAVEGREANRRVEAVLLSVEYTLSKSVV